MKQLIHSWPLFSFVSNHIDLLLPFLHTCTRYCRIFFSHFFLPACFLPSLPWPSLINDVLFHKRKNIASFLLYISCFLTSKRERESYVKAKGSGLMGLIILAFRVAYFCVKLPKGVSFLYIQISDTIHFTRLSFMVFFFFLFLLKNLRKRERDLRRLKTHTETERERWWRKKGVKSAIRKKWLYLYISLDLVWFFI